MKRSEHDKVVAREFAPMPLDRVTAAQARERSRLLMIESSAITGDKRREAAARKAEVLREWAADIDERRKQQEGDTKGAEPGVSTVDDVTKAATKKRKAARSTGRKASRVSSSRTARAVRGFAEPADRRAAATISSVSEGAWTIVFATFGLALVYLLVRPKNASRATGLIRDVGKVARRVVFPKEVFGERGAKGGALPARRAPARPATRAQANVNTRGIVP